jgi:hypothetical protein
MSQILARQRNPVFAAMISFLKEPTSVAITGSPKLWEFRAAGGVVAEGWRRFAAKIASPTLAGVLMFPNHLSIWPDSPCHKLMEHGRPPPLIRLRYYPNFIRLKLPRVCQSPVSRAVIDDHDLFLAPNWAERRADSSADPLLGVVSGNRE